ncbi:SocA family protein [Enterovibrio sp. ZSDZ42]|uniref:SocA family protein n=1 Tax=Enterovibrio gelatinilyticus TaxID=2899819 RepID=A0ABT5R0X5_9GAMM|nr:Panacea domain-containing protein [Enterovibrio sp. ZSDZ42]MDD1793924.1 SocA family protein [Enterovibrio sp. ZSDZ42]
MENLILDIIKYILAVYPHKDDLSASRLTKMLYLADWKSAIQNESQLTNAKWYFNHYGPYVDDFVELAKKDKEIDVIKTWTSFGGQKQLFKLKSDYQNKHYDLTDQSKEIVNFVIQKTHEKSYEDFIKLVYSTYPIISSSRYDELDLVPKALEYKQNFHTQH